MAALPVRTPHLFAPAGRIIRTLLVAGMVSFLSPLHTWAYDEAPVLLPATGETASPPRTNLAELENAAALGNPEACLQLGLRYETGGEVKQDYAEARLLYEKAAAGGIATAIYRLGKLRQDGLGVESDPPRPAISTRSRQWPTCRSPNIISEPCW